MLLGRHFSETDQRGLTGPLYAFGVLALLAACFFMTNVGATNLFWEVAYPFLLAGIMYMSTIWHARIFFILSFIF